MYTTYQNTIVISLENCHRLTPNVFLFKPYQHE